MRLPETCHLVENLAVFSVTETQMKITMWHVKKLSYFIYKVACDDNDDKRTMILTAIMTKKSWLCQKTHTNETTKK